MTKPGYHHGNLRAELIRHSRRIIAGQGIEALTLRAVADAAGVSRTALYRHFSNKQQLIGMVVVAGFEELRAVTLAAQDGAADALEALRGTGLAYSNFGRDNPALYAVMFSPEVHDTGCEQVATAARAAYAVLLEALTRCREAGLIKRGDLQQQAFATWAAVHGMVMLCSERAPTVQPEANLERGFEMVMQTLMEGLATQPQTES